MITRAPRHPALRGVVSLLWAGRSAGGSASHDLLIPTGGAHLSFRPCGTPIRIGRDSAQVERSGVLGGPRSVAHVHDAVPARSVGVMLCVGALPRLFQVPARELAEQHIGLDALWDRDAARLNEQLAESDDTRALDRVEAMLVSRLRPSPRPPGLVEALEALAAGARVDEVARAIGRTPRTLGLWFDHSVGLRPRRWGMLHRLRHALALARTEPDGSVVAHGAGYFDHAHLCRDLRELVGESLTTLRDHRPGEPNHIPLHLGP
ncbi:MAG: helix-turn-helix domain-containing protein [Myxococcota bacterium]